MSEVVDITELIRLKQRIVVLDRYLAERDKPDKPRAAEGHNHRADRRAERAHPAPLTLRPMRWNTPPRPQ